MKTYLYLLALGLGAMPILSASAQIKPDRKVVVEKLEKKPLDANKTPSLIKKVGERVRFMVWAEGLPKPKFSNQMNDSSPYKPFGTLLMDGETSWNSPKPPRSYAASWTAGPEMVRNPGQRIEMSADSAHTNGRNFDFAIYDSAPNRRRFNVSLMLYTLETDGSAGNNAPPERVREIQEQNERNYANPPLMGRFDVNINLSNLPQVKKKNYVWTWSDGNRKGSKLHVTVLHLGPLYASGSPLPNTGPVIVKPEFPGKIPGPSPVSKVKRPRVQTQAQTH